MNLAVISVAALVLAIVLSCFTTINVGVFAVALAWIVGVYIGGIPVATVINGFPTPLFLTLVGVTLLFAIAQCNGTLDRVAHHAVRICRGHRGVVPIMYFVLAAGLASIGPGNISTAALVAPMAMTTAIKANIPLFLMAIMVGNGSNAGSLSPFAPTGIIVNGIMARIGMDGFAGRTYVYNLLAHAAVAMLPGPIDASPAASRKNITGIMPRLPRHSRTATCATRSSVPLQLASVNSSVTPASVRNSCAGKPPITVFTGILPMNTPTIQASAIASTPTFNVVTQLTMMATANATIERTGRLMVRGL